MQLDDTRTRALLGDEGVNRLRGSHVAVFGLGGVGGHLSEALARAGVGELTVIDGDTVSTSNVNRQIIATQDTVGRPKSEVMAERILSINPECKVHPVNLFYLPENADEIDLSQFDFIADAVDTVAAKVELICRADAAGVPVIASMGAGNKLHPERFQISDIGKTSVCPLAKIMRKKMKEKGIKKLDVVWSDEEPVKAQGLESENGRNVPGSLSFVPGAVGLITAGHIIRKLSRFA
jgi:tRNA A37 threonylcarbamoyladenosine dehydratase